MEKLVTDSKFWRALGNLLLLISLMLGTVNLGVLIFKGGALVTEFRQLKVDVADIRSRGSPPYTEHWKLDDLRQQVSDEKFARMEKIVSAIPEIDKKLSVISVQIDAINKSLKP